MELSKSAAATISKYTEDLVAIDRKNDEETTALRLEYRTKMEPLLLQRHELLKKEKGFWSGILSSPETPISGLMNGTIDPKIVRAITDFQVLTRVDGNKLCRKIVVSFRQNMCVEEGQVSREVDSDMKTLSLTPLKWKQGTERARTDSFFAFFTEAFPSDVEAMSQAVESLDIIYQNPFLALVSD